MICDDRKHIKDKPKNPDWFGYCQQGHSATFAKDNTSLLFGGPGAYQWKGTCFELGDTFRMGFILLMEKSDALKYDMYLICMRHGIHILYVWDIQTHLQSVHTALILE